MPVRSRTNLLHDGSRPRRIRSSFSIRSTTTKLLLLVYVTRRGGRSRRAGSGSLCGRTLSGGNMVKIYTSGLLAILVSGCAPPRSSYVAPASTSSAPSASQALLHAWVDCMRKSYKIAAATMPDKNEAAERAFHACQSEEDDFRTSGGQFGELLFAHTKSQVKVVVINNEPF
jgi:hypothetical protein